MNFSKLIYTAVFCCAVAFLHAGEVTIVFENMPGTHGFSVVDELNGADEVLLRCSGEGRENPKFITAPKTIDVSRKKLNRFIGSVVKNMKRADAPTGEFKKGELTATWHKLEGGRVEIVVKD